MNNTRYSIDPGLPDETAFFFPKSWLKELDRWPSANGKQAKRWDDFLEEEDQEKPYWASLIDDGDYFEIFVNSQEELDAYMAYHGIKVDTETKFVWNNGKVRPVDPRL